MAAKAEITFAEGASKINAEHVAAPFRDEVRSAVQKLKDASKSVPKLVGILANDDPFARKYGEWTGKSCVADGMEFELREVENSTLQEELEKANCDPAVHGLMIYYPIFGARPAFDGGTQDEYFRDGVSAYKDVEGLSHYYRRSLYRNARTVDGDLSKKCVLPCTPLAVIKTLQHLGVYASGKPTCEGLNGKTVVVVNRSDVVGRPLAAMMANDGATVWSMDIDSMYIFRRGTLEVPPASATQESAVRSADVVVLGVPSPKYKMDVSWIKEGAVVINVASCKNIDEKALLSTVKGVRFMPAVGKVTVAMLMRNVVQLHSNFGEEVAAGSDGQERILSRVVRQTNGSVRSAPY